jgi:tripartite ATP-independent transporter DctM subunit
VILVIYGILTAQDIGKLFLAGLVPGLVGILGYVVAVRVSLLLRPEPGIETLPKLPLRARLAALRGVSGALALFAFVLGGIYLGVFTATEAAGMGAFGATLLTAARGRLRWAETLRTLFDTAKMTAVLFFILFGALYFKNYVNLAGLTTDLREWLTALGAGPYEVVFMCLVLFLVLGCVLESLSMILLTVPVLFPVVTGLGWDPIWFGIFVVVATELSFITPPVGMNVFVMRIIAPDIPLGRVFAGVVPFVGADVVRLGLLIALPGIALWLPNTM